MSTEIFPPAGKIEAEINLPASKSISNRVLIIRALCGDDFGIKNLSEAGDTKKLEEILASDNKFIHAGEGGTTLRFLLALLALKGEECIVTASASLLARPVAPLIDALRHLGSNIEYLEQDQFLPVKIHAAALTGNEVVIAGDISSQFISALMLVAPMINGGLTINITGEVLSMPYIMMTKAVMEYFGVKVNFHINRIMIEESRYKPEDIVIEPDWSAASYWYEIAALSPGSRVMLKNINERSLQGDAVVSDMMQQLGVITKYTNEGALLTGKGGFEVPSYFSGDFLGCPDLGTAVAATCAGLNITADLHGLKNFRLKESDRASAMQRELYKMNVKTDFCGRSKFKIFHGSGIKNSRHPVSTYNDHRVAMAFAPLSIKTGSILLDNEGVVQKSYPGYFSDLVQAGFRVERT